VSSLIDDAVASNVKGVVKSVAREILGEMGIEALCQKLTDIPEQIRKLQSQIPTAQHKVDATKCRMEEAKSIVVAEIAGEINPNGKPAYSNEVARTAELAIRLKADADGEDYQLAKVDLQAAEEDLFNIRFDIERLQNEMGNYKTMLTARAAQITALFGN